MSSFTQVYSSPRAEVSQFPCCLLESPVLPFCLWGEFYLHESCPHISTPSTEKRVTTTHEPLIPFSSAISAICDVSQITELSVPRVLLLHSPFPNLLLSPFPVICTNSTACPGSSKLLLRSNIHRCILHPLPKLVQQLIKLPFYLKSQIPEFGGGLLQYRSFCINIWFYCNLFTAWISGLSSISSAALSHVTLVFS